MKKKESFLHDYKGFGNCKSQCRVDILEDDIYTLIVFTDIDEGTSVTNMTEHLAEEIVKLKGLENNLKNVRFFESYVYPNETTLDEIKYVRKKDASLKFINPEWSPVDKNLYNTIVNMIT